MNFILSIFQNYALTIFFVSVVGCIISTILPVVSYRMPMMLICLFLALSSIYLKGGEDQRLRSEVKEKEEQAKVAVLEKKQAELTSSIASISAANRALVLENGRLKNVNQYISQSEENACNIGPGFVRLHNESAEGKLSNAAK